MIATSASSDGRRVGAPALAERLGRLGALLALALEHGDLLLLVEVAARLLRLLLEAVHQQAQRGDPRAVLGLGGGRQVGLDAFGDAHPVKGSGGGPSGHARAGAASCERG